MRKGYSEKVGDLQNFSKVDMAKAGIKFRPSN